MRSVIRLSGRLIVPVSPSTASCTPCHPINPASVTTNEGIPNVVTMKPVKSPIAAPVASPATIASSGDHPCWTLSTAITEAASPLTAPTERSISPSSSTRTTPIEIVATPVIWSTRFERLTAVRKRSLASWKMIQITAMITITRTVANSP